MSHGPDRTHTNQTATLLFADDHQPWHRWLREILLVRPQWKLVATACDGEEAVRKAIELQPDVAILDIGMPLLNGIEAAERIRDKCPRSHIVFLTQDPDPDIRDTALAIAGTRYVVKERVFSELVRAISAALADEKFRYPD